MLGDGRGAREIVPSGQRHLVEHFRQLHIVAVEPRVDARRIVDGGVRRKRLDVPIVGGVHERLRLFVETLRRLLADCAMIEEAIDDRLDDVVVDEVGLRLKFAHNCG